MRSLHPADRAAPRGTVKMLSSFHPTELPRKGARLTTKTSVDKERVVVRFAADSGDGMQLTGDRFTSATAILGNGLAALPDCPAEIRGPARTLAAVRAVQRR